jgi:hypothetical protein
MTQPQETSHIEPSEHSTKEVDEKLREVEREVARRGAGSPAIKPNKDLDDDGTPLTDGPHNSRI